MADLQRQFLIFHSAIKLGTYEENGSLREKRNLVIAQMKNKRGSR